MGSLIREMELSVLSLVGISVNTNVCAMALLSLVALACRTAKCLFLNYRMAKLCSGT